MLLQLGMLLFHFAILGIATAALALGSPLLLSLGKRQVTLDVAC